MNEAYAYDDGKRGEGIFIPQRARYNPFQKWHLKRIAGIPDRHRGDNTRDTHLNH